MKKRITRTWTLTPFVESEKSRVQLEKHGKATFEIIAFSVITEKYTTEPVDLCGRKWAVSVYPQGNRTDSLSMYLTLVGPKDIFCDIRFTIEVVDQNNGLSVKRESTHRFNESSDDWGFKSFMKLDYFRLRNGDFLKDNKMIINLALELMDQNRNAGLKRYYQHTYYLNPMLHTFHYIPLFCLQVLQLKNPQNTIVRVLQIIFYRLKFDATSTGTQSLRKVLEWVDDPKYELKHKPAKLFRKLLENLMDEMKGTEAEHNFKKLFQGTIKSFVKSAHFESANIESFLDITLSTEECSNVLESFEKFVEMESMVGHGLQNIWKGKKFLSFPPILVLHMKRARKVHYNIPETLNLSSVMAEEATQYPPPTFFLHSVLICDESVQRESYYSYIRFTPNGEWFLVFDDRIAPAKPTFMCSNLIFSSMLVYLRQSDVSNLFFHFNTSCLSESVLQRVENAEISRKKRIAKDVQMLSLHIMTDVNLYAGASGIVAHFTGRKIKIWRGATIKDLRHLTSKRFGIEPKESQVFWKCKTEGTLLSLHSSLLPEEEEIFLSTITQQTEYCLFLTLSSSPPHPNDIFLLLMAYDPVNEIFQNAHYVITKNTNKLADIFPVMANYINEIPSTPLLVFHVESRSINPIPLRPTCKLDELGLRNCSVLIFQQQNEVREISTLRFPLAPAFYNFLFHPS